jgi:hypothetical protein
MVSHLCRVLLTKHIAIGWSLTGTMNSPSTNVAVMYTADSNNTREKKPAHDTNHPSILSVLSDAQSNDHIKSEGTPAAMLSAMPFSVTHGPPQAFNPTAMLPPSTNYSAVTTPDSILVSDADLLLNLHSTYPASSPNTSTYPAQNQAGLPSYLRNVSIPAPTQSISSHQLSPTAFGPFPTPADVFGDMVIDSQDVDMSALSADMPPWDLEFLPSDFNMFFGDGLGDGTADTAGGDL